MLKKLICMGMVALMLLSVFCLAACNDKNKNESARNRIKEITEIEVPNDAKVLYNYYEIAFVNGRRTQYTVFELKNEPADWSKENTFLDGRDAEYEKYFLSYFKSFIGPKQLSNELIPNLEEPYLWLWIEHTYLFYYPDKLLLIFFVPGL